MRCSIVFGVTLRLLVINLLSSFPAINAAPLTTSDISVTTYRTVVRWHVLIIPDRLQY